MIDTPRLRLRRFRPEDAPALAAYRSDPQVARYQGWESPLSAEAAAAQVASYAAGDPRRPGWFQYAIELRAEGRLIGDLGVGLHENLRQAEVGFTLAADRQGQGYASEAVRALVDALFAGGLHKVSAECDARNASSARLLERVGFRREGLRRSHTWFKGEWTDDLVFGLLADDPRPTGPGS
ncbi:GNAT family protein [Kitasatospora terrestris]|uniref:GNAT family protein n=1 Tax=Kitasatospora terrestris TaxID=258051 RepID=A0ABP9EH37_9ACTN